MLIITSYSVFLAHCYMCKKHNIIYKCIHIMYWASLFSTKPSMSTLAYSYQYMSKATIGMRLGSSNNSVALRYTRAASSRRLSSRRMPYQNDSLGPPTDSKHISIPDSVWAQLHPGRISSERQELRAAAGDDLKQ